MASLFKIPTALLAIASAAVLMNSGIQAAFAEAAPNELLFHFGAIDISVIQTTAPTIPGKNLNIESLGGTSISIETRRAQVSLDSIIDSVVFKNVQSQAGAEEAGIQVPSLQTLPGYFALIKQGDADTRLILINSQGKVLDLPWEQSFVNSEGNTLFLIRTDPDQGLEYAMLDLRSSEFISHETDEKQLRRIYPPKTRYQLFENSGKIFAKQEEERRAQQLLVLDPGSHQFAPTRSPAPWMQSGQMLKQAFEGVQWLSLPDMPSLKNR